MYDFNLGIVGYISFTLVLFQPQNEQNVIVWKNYLSHIQFNLFQRKWMVSLSVPKISWNKAIWVWNVMMVSKL